MLSENTKIYTIVHSTSTTEDGSFVASKSRGSYLSLAAARRELEKQIEAERKEAPGDYDCEEQGKDYWMRYQDGFAAAAYTRLEIVPTILDLGRIA